MNRDICSNKWCRATYEFEGDDAPGFCQKCNSFNNELSNGVSWNEKTYSTPLYDGQTHQSTIISKDMTDGKTQVTGTKFLFGEKLMKFFLNK
jgi:hypothetical protein